MSADADADHAPAFDGIGIIDATEGIGGPYAAMLLAEQGADVIKIERPSGDPARGTPAFHVLNRSKRSVVLDLETEPGRAQLRRLLSDADVFLYDWPLGHDAAIGFDPATLRALNLRLISGYLPSYGSTGPHAGLAAGESLVQAVSGAADAQFRYDAQPVRINIPIAGYAQGIIAAGAVAASLFARMQTGRGDSFELSQVGAIFAMQTVAYVRASGVQRLAGRAGPRGGIPTYRLVKASDDWLFAGALTPGFWASLAVAIGIEDCLVDPRFAAAPMGIPDMDARRELAGRLDEAFTHRTRDEWLRILEDAGVPRAPVLSREEFAADPQVAHNKMMIDIDDPQLGPTKQMGIALSLSDTPGRVRGPAPTLGQHQSLLDDLSPRAAATAPPDASTRRYPLEGVVIVDLSGFIAGANGSMMLADMGATVIKVEALDGDGWRNSGLAFLGSNRGKRSVCIDLKREEGRALLLDMVERADVVMDNYRAGVMDRLGIGYDALRARNRRIIHCSVTGYGPSGPYAHLPGFDPLFQARSGLMRAQGEPGGEPVYLQISVCDYATALTAAYGVIAALVARERTGHGNRVETSLLNSAFSVQPGAFIYYEGRPGDSPGGRDLPGHHALDRIYPASDGHLALACTKPAHSEALASTIGIALPEDALSQPATGDLASTITQRLATHDRAHWLREFTANGVPAAPCIAVDAIFEDEHLHANNLWWDFEHPTWGAIRQTGAVVNWHDMSMRIDRRAPLLAEHSAECLAELGISDARVTELMAAGVVR